MGGLEYPANFRWNGCKKFSKWHNRFLRHVETISKNSFLMMSLEKKGPLILQQFVFNEKVSIDFCGLNFQSEQRKSIQLRSREQTNSWVSVIF
jgi:hypothetical protein